MLIGHKEKTKIFKELFTSDVLSHGYIFFGEEQVGKKSFALAFANFLEKDKFESPSGVLSETKLISPEEGSIGIDTVKELDWKSCDFSEGQIFEDGVKEQDFKIQLYPKVAGYNYFHVESQGQNIWIIDKKITEAARKDCTEKITDAKSSNNLRSGQTLCIKTKENNIALVGGFWDGLPDENTKLSWKYYP